MTKEQIKQAHAAWLSMLFTTPSSSVLGVLDTEIVDDVTQAIAERVVRVGLLHGHGYITILKAATSLGISFGRYLAKLEADEEALSRVSTAKN